MNFLSLFGIRYYDQSFLKISFLFLHSPVRHGMVLDVQQKQTVVDCKKSRDLHHREQVCPQLSGIHDIVDNPLRLFHSHGFRLKLNFLSHLYKYDICSCPTIHFLTHTLMHNFFRKTYWVKERL